MVQEVLYRYFRWTVLSRHERKVARSSASNLMAEFDFKLADIVCGIRRVFIDGRFCPGTERKCEIST